MKIITKWGLLLFTFGICGCVHPSISTSSLQGRDPEAETEILNLLNGWDITDIRVSISHRNVAVQIVGVQEAKSSHDLSDETYVAAKKFIEEKRLPIQHITVSAQAY